jgi:hypothetical protein
VAGLGSQSPLWALTEEQRCSRAKDPPLLPFFGKETVRSIQRIFWLNAAADIYEMASNGITSSK